MRVVLGGEKAAIAMQDIRRTRIFIVITPLVFFEVTETIMFVMGGADRARAGMAGMSKIAKGRVKSHVRAQMQIADRNTYLNVRTCTYQKVRDPEAMAWPWRHGMAHAMLIFTS